MCLDRIGKLLDANAGNNLIVACNLKELLIEDIVFMRVNKRRNIPDYRQNIEFISLDRVVGEEDIMQLQIEEVVSHGPHHLIGLHVVHVEDVQIVKAVVE